MVLTASVLGVIEYHLHQRRIYSIPIRIHVNGTRGKSSVTRLIGAALREGGIRTITKVTGTYPRLILEDGTETSIFRRANANIIEQLSIVKFASERKAEALVIECMALEPQYQSITEEKMIHATIGVITNIRLDHVDIMGYTLREVANVLGRTIPNKQHLFTSENQIPDILKEIANDKKCSIHFSNVFDVTDEEMNHFKYIEHKENVALVLSICKHLGIERSVALKGMYKANPDSGALMRYDVFDSGKEIIFYNGFAANDPQSTLMIWQKLEAEKRLVGSKILLLNTRQDRLDRAKQLAEMVGEEIKNDADLLILIGQSTDIVESLTKDFGFEKDKIINLGWTKPENVFNSIFELTKDISTVLAIGNVGGMGNPVVEYFFNKSLALENRSN
ncbi:MAG: Capsule biosynthesis protein CapB [Ignavibacteria bacterium ADurb.Bin266]|jgi:poly-gamma-glutamate synthase PgsB/CapB|nr:MAG: Capsule biosynthesis protein CapB [Ignavibacteria bacterium ADurb.Bin266]